MSYCQQCAELQRKLAAAEARAQGLEAALLACRNTAESLGSPSRVVAIANAALAQSPDSGKERG